MLDKVFGFIIVAAPDFLDLFFSLFVFELIGIHQRRWVNSNDVVDDKFHAVQTDALPCAGRRHQRNAPAGLAMFIIIRVRVSGMSFRLLSVSSNSRMPS